MPGGVYKPVFENLNEVSKELAAHEQERKRLEMMREEWISNVSHDMKTPLASIRGYAELLNDGKLTADEQRDYAHIIEKQSLHMQDLLDDLNLTMRLRHQQLPLSLTEVNMVQFIREIVIDTLNTPQYEEANIEFNATNDVIKHHIDEHFMRRAIMNFYTMHCFIILLMYQLLFLLKIIQLRFPIMVTAFPPKILNIFSNAIIEVQILSKHMVLG